MKKDFTYTQEEIEKLNEMNTKGLINGSIRISEENKREFQGKSIPINEKSLNEIVEEMKKKL